MTSRVDDGHRRLIPRWRYTARTIIGFEHAGDPRVPVRNRPPLESIEPLLAAWRRAPSQTTAGDVLSAALVAGRRELALEPSDWLLRHDDGVPAELRRAAQWALAPPSCPPEDMASERRLDVGASRISLAMSRDGWIFRAPMLS